MLCTWLQRVVLDAALVSHRSLLGGTPPSGYEFTVHATGDTGLLAARLSVLHAARFVDTSQAEKAAVVHLYRLPLQTDVVAALSGLPHWGGEVILTAEHWPAQSPAYKALAAHMPVTYSRWRLAGGDVPPAAVASISRAVAERRQGLGLSVLRIFVEGQGKDELRREGVSIRYVGARPVPASVARAARTQALLAADPGLAADEEW